MPAAPQIKSRQTVVSNPWVTLVRKDVEMHGAVADYYSLELPDYVAVVARTPSGKLALVRQYRPAVEQFILELPAGTVEAGESPDECCLRELREEVGLSARSLRSLGVFMPDTGRLSNRQHIFLAETEEETVADFVPETGLEIVYATPAQVEGWIRTADFPHLLHISALYLSGILPAA